MKTAPVAYQDKHLLVLDKPAGMPSVRLSSDETGTAVNAALAIDPSLARAGDRTLEAGLLHRLDNGTSGLLGFARTPEAFAFYKNAWKQRRVRKVYRALVGVSSTSTLHSVGFPLAVDWPISRSAKSTGKVIVHVPGRRIPKSATRGEPLAARTIVTELHWLDSLGPRKDAHADLTIEIETGVMHQIRAHIAALGAPIVGDTVYGVKITTEKRLWLHAWKLGLPRMDTSGELLWVEAPLPEGWTAARFLV